MSSAPRPPWMMSAPAPVVMVSLPWPPKIRNSPFVSAEPLKVRVSPPRSAAPVDRHQHARRHVGVVHGEVVIVGRAERSEPRVLRRDQADILDADDLVRAEDDRVIAAKAELVGAGAAVDGVARSELQILAEVEDVGLGAAGQGVDAAAAPDEEAAVGLGRAVEGEILAGPGAGWRRRSLARPAATFTSRVVMS
jgi:hypothetical protein